MPRPRKRKASAPSGKRASRNVASPKRKRLPARSQPSAQPDPAAQSAGLGAYRMPIVALGASAGGMAALQQFFEQLPADSGMAYLVVTHQAPDRVSLLPELLGRHAQVPFTVAADGVQPLPDRAYVAPPGHSLAIEHGRLRVVANAAHDGLALPIDQTLRALAHAQGEHAIGIVLSGSGSDGSLGVAAIKSALGMVMAQDPRSAQYPSMPASAISTQCVDYVLRPEQMPEQLLRYVRSGYRAPVPAYRFDDDHGGLASILAALRARTGNDFREYKKSTIKRRIERRMQVHGIVEAEAYVRLLEGSPYEVDALLKELLISVTSFFRDPGAFDALAHELTKLVELKGQSQPLRIWVSGCATGEEAYSVAITAKEVMQRCHKDLKVQIFATDLDQQAVDIARSGRYADGIAADVGAKRLGRFFTREENGYRVNKEIRDLTVFAVQNVVKDPPFTRLDLLTCRNLLIYLEPELQKRVLATFSYSLRPDGLLLLGTSENLSGFDDRFSTLDKRWKLFQRLITPAPALPELAFDKMGLSLREGYHPVARADRRAVSVASVTDRLLLDSFVPPSVIISERGELIYVHGRIGAYFEPAAGEPSQNAFSMAREGLRAELPTAIRKAAAIQGSVVRRGLQVRTNGGFSKIVLIVRRLPEPEALRGAFVVSFDDQREVEPLPKKGARKAHRVPGRVGALEEELQSVRKHLEGTIDELEISNQDLKSINEELQSTNEELQSANEELETSREEMQSLNEELHAVNSELEERNRALSQANDDMQNLLNSTDVATLFLDDDLNVKRFTTQAKKVFSLIDGDIGRPIADLAANLRYDALVAEARQVLDTLVLVEREIQTKAGRWRLMRIMSYRTHENLIDGLVITFVDIDRLKSAERAEKEARAYAEGVVDVMTDSILLLDAELCAVFANTAFCDAFGTSAERVARQPVQAITGWSDGELIEHLQALVVDGTPFELDAPRSLRTPRPQRLRARRLPARPERALFLMLAFEETGS
jgi:two-component system CheB/CheR fusion protein